jgi:hypothetical protein
MNGNTSHLVFFSQFCQMNCLACLRNVVRCWDADGQSLKVVAVFFRQIVLLLCYLSFRFKFGSTHLRPIPEAV